MRYRTLFFAIFFLLSSAPFAHAAYTITQGGTGTSTHPTYGQLLLGNSSGEYSLVATSSLGISGGGSSGPATSTNPLLATYLVATSTTATSTFAGPLLIGSAVPNTLLQIGPPVSLDGVTNQLSEPQVVISSKHNINTSPSQEGILTLARSGLEGSTYQSLAEFLIGSPSFSNTQLDLQLSHAGVNTTAMTWTNTNGNISIGFPAPLAISSAATSTMAGALGIVSSNPFTFLQVGPDPTGDAGTLPFSDPSMTVIGKLPTNVGPAQEPIVTIARTGVGGMLHPAIANFSMGQPGYGNSEVNLNVWSNTGGFAKAMGWTNTQGVLSTDFGGDLTVAGTGSISGNATVGGTFGSGTTTITGTPALGSAGLDSLFQINRNINSGVSFPNLFAIAVGKLRTNGVDSNTAVEFKVNTFNTNAGADKVVMTLDDTGSVGIATTTLPSALSVDGDVNVLSQSRGLILHDTVTSSCYRIQVTAGALVPTSITCP